MIVDAGFAWQLDLVNDPPAKTPLHVGSFALPGRADGMSRRAGGAAEPAGMRRMNQPSLPLYSLRRRRCRLRAADDR